MIEVPYLPQDPKSYRPGIGLIGCGNISREHLLAYRAAGYRVLALCDVDLARADKRRREFYPEATVTTDPADLLRRDDIEVVDITTHPPIRPPLIEAALRARKHVLSQKPFVLDLDVGQRLVDLADSQGVRLAVNQNGRWAPHWSYIREAITRGLLGTISGVHLAVHWDHGWTLGTPFEKVRHLILYDYAIHWFDIVNCFLRDRPAKRVFASFAFSQMQTVGVPLLAQALMEFDGAQASLAFDADTPFGSQNRTYVAGSLGSAWSVGPSDRVQQLTVATREGTIEPPLTGSWFPDGFHGTMGELLRAIEENREPSNSGANNLQSLALCFAAIASAESHQPVVPGSVRKLG